MPPDIIYQLAYLFSKSDNTKNYVTFSEEQVKQFEDNILTHNHPGGSTFSCEDVSLLTYSKMQEIRATTSKGTFSLRANKDSKSYEKIIAIQFICAQSIVMVYMRSCWKIIKTLGLMRLNFRRGVMH